MKLEIKLDDPKYCNGCPCLRNYNEFTDYCAIYGKINYDFKFKKCLRPKECVEINGE